MESGLKVGDKEREGLEIEWRGYESSAVRSSWAFTRSLSISYSVATVRQELYARSENSKIEYAADLFSVIVFVAVAVSLYLRRKEQEKCLVESLGYVAGLLFRLLM